MNALGYDEAKLDGADIAGLDAYTRDGVFIGRAMGWLPLVPEDEREMEEGHTDPAGRDGRPSGARHLVIDGTGTVVQSRLLVALSDLAVDLRGRRVTVPLTLAEIEARPKHDRQIAQDATAR
jgi:hypothetical protein